jgi:3-deoxy-D-manno-oct-2-ulosonic acid (Kdo) hydroxylase
MDVLETLDLSSLESVDRETQQKSIRSLEEGKVIYLPKLGFALNPHENAFLTPKLLSPKSKNVSFDSRRGVHGADCENKDELKAMMERFASHANQVIKSLFPAYADHIKQGRTSFRPAEISGRPSSYRKDDTRLHVDAFPATPVRGNRILRVFTNVNPNGVPRIWKLGEPFETVVEKIIPWIHGPLPGLSYLLKTFKITKGVRSAYDHYMLHMHDMMKGDLEYQKSAGQTEFHFPPQSTWVVYTDQVSHAALSGQFLFEQTFYLPPKGLCHEESSPLKILERFLGKKLI